MKDYLVRLEIHMEGDSPLDAAKRVEELLSQPSSLSGGWVFDVVDEDEERTWQVDTVDDSVTEVE